MTRWLNWVTKKIIETGKLKPNLTVKYFHCKKNLVPPVIRTNLARKMTNIYKSNETKRQIRLARQIIEIQKSAIDTIIYPSLDIIPNAPSCKATQVEVLKLIKERASILGVKGVGIRTIKKYWNQEPLDMEVLVEKENLDLLELLEMV